MKTDSKTLHNSDASAAKGNVPDIKIFGDGDTWKLLCKASSEKEGWMKSTKVLEVAGVGCLVQVTTHQRGHIGGNDAIAEAVTFMPRVRLAEKDGVRFLEAIPQTAKGA